MENSLTIERIIDKIYLIRDLKVMMDADLAKLYGVATRDLNKAVRRNFNRFPEDFMFQLSQMEFEHLMFQIGTSSWGGTRKLPFVFTELGVAMLSSVLRSDRAIRVNIQIMRVFTKMHKLLDSHQDILKRLDELQRKGVEHDHQIILIFEYLDQLEKLKQKELEQNTRQRIGYKRSDEEDPDNKH
jgi:hypothetical protein